MPPQVDAGADVVTWLEGGPRIGDLDATVTDDGAIQKAVRELIPDAEVIWAVAYDWNVDPYSRGTWCIYRPNQLARYLREDIHVYPPFVWAMVRPLARWRVHPNWVTALDYVATFAAVPFFLAGNWVPEMVLAYLMSVLDSVDGKLARLTYTSSRFGEILDHGLDIVHPPIWYLAWGYSLGGGDLSSPTFRASLWMFGFYVADRIATGIFKGRTGRSIHGFTPLDEKVRSFISRRNVNLALFTVALLLDWALPGLRAAEFTFYFIVLWQAACLIWHAERVVQFWNARPAR